MSGQVAVLLGKAIALLHQHGSGCICQDRAERVVAPPARLPRDLEGTAEQCFVMGSRLAGLDSMRHQSSSDLATAVSSVGTKDRRQQCFPPELACQRFRIKK